MNRWHFSAGITFIFGLNSIIGFIEMRHSAPKLMDAVMFVNILFMIPAFIYSVQRSGGNK